MTHKLVPHRAQLSLSLALLLAVALGCQPSGSTPQAAMTNAPTLATPFKEPKTPARPIHAEVTAATTPQAALTAERLDCFTPTPAQEALTPANGDSTALVSFPPCSDLVHGVIFETEDGLQAFDDGKTSTIVTWSQLGAVPRFADLSADSGKLAYTQTGQDVWVADLGAGRAGPLVQGALRTEHAMVMGIAWSPDGGWLAVEVGDWERGVPVLDQSTLFTVEASTGEAHEIAAGTSAFAWAAHTGKVAYIGESEGEGALFTAWPDGTGERQIYKGRAALEPWLASSPRDGTLVLVEFGGGRDKLLAVNPCTGSAFDLLGHYEGGRLVPEYPVWSPDGRRVAFIDMAGDLYLVHAAGAEVRLCGSDLVWPLAWSPDSSMLVARDQGDFTLRLVEIRDRGAMVQDLGFGTFSTSLLGWR